MHSGLAHAPGNSQELMSIVLHDIEEIAMKYLDDIIIFSPKLEHKEHIQLVYNQFRNI